MGDQTLMAQDEETSLFTCFDHAVIEAKKLEQDHKDAAMHAAR